MSKLLIGFDSAWSASKSGAIVGLVQSDCSAFLEIDPPQTVNYSEAERTIVEWQERYNPGATIVLLDQPTIVRNGVGQRPVENIVGSVVSRRHGGMQPANTSKVELFGSDAPVWSFLDRFGGPANPFGALTGTWVLETYPVLTMIALDWLLPDRRPTGRLPKFNPERKKTYSINDWRYVCQKISEEFGGRNIEGLTGWLDDIARSSRPRKSDQDGLDACVCLLTALHLIEMRECLMVGDQATGYIVVPYGRTLSDELMARCKQTDRDPSEWVRSFVLSLMPSA